MDIWITSNIPFSIRPLTSVTLDEENRTGHLGDRLVDNWKAPAVPCHNIESAWGEFWSDMNRLKVFHYAERLNMLPRLKLHWYHLAVRRNVV